METGSNKQPWLACCYSIILPGSGHIYSQRCLEGIVWILVYTILDGLFVYTLMRNNCPFSFSFLIAVFSFILLPIYCSYDSYRKTKTPQEVNHRKTKNVWLAMFLSIIFAPLGYIYLKKWIYFIISLIVFFAVLIFIDFPGNLVLVTIAVCVHIALRLFNLERTNKTRLLALMSFLLVIEFTGDFFVSSIFPRYLFDFERIYRDVSMRPNLEVGDFVLLNVYRSKHEDMNVGDIVFVNPIQIDESTKTAPSYKRIIAVGGETIQIRNGLVYINGQATRRYPYTKTATDEKSRNFIYEYADKEPYEIPADSYFLLGDHQRISLDSKTYGAVKESELGPVVTKILWPPKRIGVIIKSTEKYKGLK